MELQSTFFEAAARTKKRDALVAVILLDAVGAGEDPFAPEFARQLSEAGEDFWTAATVRAGCTPPSSITQNEVVVFFAVAAARKHPHTKDSDCTVGPATECCIGCGTLHGDACPVCNQCGFHADGCPAVLQ